MHILLQYHGHNVAAARRGAVAYDDALTHANHHRPHERRQHEVVRKVQCATRNLRGVQRLERGFRGIGQPGERVHDERRAQGGHQRARTQFAAQQHHRQDEQGHVQDVAERTYLNGGEQVVEYDARAVNAAGHNIIWVDEENEAGRHDGTAQQDVQPREQILFHDEVACDVLGLKIVARRVAVMGINAVRARPFPLKRLPDAGFVAQLARKITLFSGA